MSEDEKSSVMIRFICNVRELIKKPKRKRPPLETDSKSIAIEAGLEQEESTKSNESDKQSSKSDDSIPPPFEIQTYRELLESDDTIITSEDLLYEWNGDALNNPMALGDVIILSSDEICQASKMTQTNMKVQTRGTQTEILEDESTSVDKSEETIEWSSSPSFDLNKLV